MVSYKQNVCKQKSVLQYALQHYMKITDRTLKQAICAQLSFIKLVYLNYQNSYYSIWCQILSVKMLRFFLFQKILNCQHNQKKRIYIYIYIYNFEAEEKGRCNYTLLKEHFTSLLQCNNSQAYYIKIPRET